MSIKIRKHTDAKKTGRFKRKLRIKAKVAGSLEQPRLCIFKSNSNLYAQIVDDSKGNTLLMVSTLEKEFKGKLRSNLAGAKEVGKVIAERALKKNISKVIFDRSGYLYHGKIKAFADSAREAGLQF